VRDYRLNTLVTAPNCEMYVQSPVDVDIALGMGCQHIFIATGSSWRRDGVGRTYSSPLVIGDDATVLTPDDIVKGASASGSVVIFDDDHYYMGSVMAEVVSGKGLDVTLVTPAALVADWTQATLEQGMIETRLIELGVTILERCGLRTVTGGTAVIVNNSAASRIHEIACDTLVLVTSRLPDDMLYRGLMDRQASWTNTGLQSVNRIGDCFAPSTIAAAVYSGYEAAREFEIPEVERLFQREFF